MAHQLVGRFDCRGSDTGNQPLGRAHLLRGVRQQRGRFAGTAAGARMRAEDDRIAGFERDQGFVDRRGRRIGRGQHCRDDADGLADLDNSVLRAFAKHADRAHPAHALRQQIGGEHVLREFIGGVAVTGFLYGDLGKALRMIAGGGGDGFDDRVNLRLGEEAIASPRGMGLLDFAADLLNRYEVGIADHLR